MSPNIFTRNPGVGLKESYLGQLLEEGDETLGLPRIYPITETESIRKKKRKSKPNTQRTYETNKERERTHLA